MKTHVRTKLGWSKLVLISVTLATVAMLTVLGLFFTNANADDTADPANAEINIPVSILSPKMATVGSWQSTDWTVEPSKIFTDSGSFKGHTITISDDKRVWTGETDSYAMVVDGALVIALDTENADGHFYKRWVFDCTEKEKWYVESEGKVQALDEYVQFPLQSKLDYSFSYGQPQMFSVIDHSSDAKAYTGKLLDFDGNSSNIQGAFPHYFTLNSIAATGSVSYTEDKPYTLSLKFQDKEGKTWECHIDPKVKIAEGVNYFWTYNEKTISKESGNPTPINLAEPIDFELQKGGSPTPPDPIKSFKVKGTVVDADENPIPNASIGFYNSDVDSDLAEPLISTLSAEDGSFVLDGCYSGTKNPGDLKITYTAKHYDSDVAPISYEEAKTGEVDLGELDPLKDAVLDLYSDSPEHKSFTVTAYYQAKGEDQPKLQYSRTVEYFGKANEGNSNEDNYVFDISDNGVITNVDAGEYGTTTTIVVPNGQDGYIFDNYLINDKTSYRAGDSVDIMQHMKADGYARVAVNYTADTSKIAQTSDENIYAVAALIAIVVSVGTLLVLRRRKLDF